MKTLTEILEEELTAIQDLLEEGDQLVIERMSVRLEQLGPQVDAALGGTARLTKIVAIGPQAIAAILEERHAAKE